MAKRQAFNIYSLGVDMGGLTATKKSPIATVGRGMHSKTKESFGKSFEEFWEEEKEVYAKKRLYYWTTLFKLSMWTTTSANCQVTES
ncbi:hypothetical protein ACTXT7_005931 [Hymenolepis weldensis]